MGGGGGTVEATLLSALFLATLGYGLTRLALTPFLAILTGGGLIHKNFRGDPIPVGYGLVVALVGSLGALATGGRAGTALAALLLGFALLGFLDDALGDRGTGGLRGHLMALVSGRPTTGAIKALLGGLLSLAVAWNQGGGAWRVIMDALLMALSANAVNLLDLRPGRALKVFLALGLPALFTPVGPALAALYGGAVSSWRWDLRGRAMLGDGGSNPLGAALGFTALFLPVEAAIGALVILVVFHVYTERASLSEVIERRPWLRYLDELGRSREGSAP